jgi:APA family basic amino acid/polyamine antiporter
VPLLWIFTLLATSQTGLIQSWNESAALNHTLDYQSFLGAVETTIGGTLPQTWNWHDTFGLTGSMALLLISYVVVYVGGEVKRPERSTLVAGWSSIAVSAALAAGVFAALYHTVGYRMLAAGAVNYVIGLQPYPNGSAVNLAAIAAHGNRAVGVVTSLAFLLTSFWLMAVMLIVLSRTMFAWGMDRMGPKWFTSVNPRTATPVWNFVTYLVLTLIGLVIYQTWIPTMSLFVGVAVFLIGVYLITGVSALALPYRKKTRDIWNSSPYRGWKIAGIPVICIAGVVWMLYTGVLLYYQFFDPQVRPSVGGFKQIYFLVACGVLGVLWYLFWAWRSRKVGVDVRFQYRQLPPE